MNTFLASTNQWHVVENKAKEGKVALEKQE
jgi:hypothetical protein